MCTTEHNGNEAIGFVDKETNVLFFFWTCRMTIFCACTTFVWLNKWKMSRTLMPEFRVQIRLWLSFSNKSTLVKVIERLTFQLYVLYIYSIYSISQTNFITCYKNQFVKYWHLVVRICIHGHELYIFNSWQSRKIKDNSCQLIKFPCVTGQSPEKTLWVKLPNEWNRHTHSIRLAAMQYKLFYCKCFNAMFIWSSLYKPEQLNQKGELTDGCAADKSNDIVAEDTEVISLFCLIIKGFRRPEGRTLSFTHEHN